MNSIDRIYRCELGLFIDLYELTMACGYWKLGRADLDAVFHLSFRRNPFKGGYTIACGLAQAIDFLREFRFDQSDTDYLATLKGNDGGPLLDAAFLDYLRGLEFRCDLDAAAEGTVVFPEEPVLRVQGPLLQGQILETSLLNMLNFQSLIATKASRVCAAARGEPVLEFGMRRAQGIDGSLSASRAAYVGGCAGTSNALAGKLFGVPVGGTLAHSWIMSFDSEQDGFEAYAQALPNNCILLVDTYDTLEGVRRAIEVGKGLRRRGYEIIGIRLDSGDLAVLSIEARRMLDEAGFAEAVIVGSGDLDEHAICTLKDRGARINVWGVGTRLVTAYDEPALAGVYKLAAIRHPGQEWRNTLKLSEDTGKSTMPGQLAVRRYRSESSFIADMIYDQEQGVPPDPTSIDLADPTRQQTLSADWPHEDLLVPVFRGGRQVYNVPDVHAARRRTQDQLAALDPSVRRLVNPDQHNVGLEKGLYDLRARLIREARGKKC
jgi:nicotinate phosphoribosyltransferase